MDVLSLLFLSQSKVTFTCQDYDKIYSAVKQLKSPGDAAAVTVKTVGRDNENSKVVTFFFTWSLKIRS